MMFQQMVMMDPPMAMMISQALGLPSPFGNMGSMMDMQKMMQMEYAAAMGMGMNGQGFPGGGVPPPGAPPGGPPGGMDPN